MKTTYRKTIGSLLAVAVLGLLCSCRSFSTVADAPDIPYRPPPGARSGAFDGQINKGQVAHLQNAVFPRLDETERALMIEINRDVNEDITYLSDEDNYGFMDFAMEEPRFRKPLARGLGPARYGDCEDYALTKKHRLTERGMDPSRLFVVRTKVPTSEGEQRHVVLAVPEGSDWWILNNWDNRIEAASYLAKWWDWEFIWPRFDEYQRVAQARNGSHYAAGPLRSR